MLIQHKKIDFIYLIYLRTGYICKRNVYVHMFFILNNIAWLITRVVRVRFHLSSLEFFLLSYPAGPARRIHTMAFKSPLFLPSHVSRRSGKYPADIIFLSLFFLEI